MPIRQFTRQFWFPSGVLAASLPARVFPLDSNALATLYTDGTGTVQLPNPLTTDVNGTVSFWAEEGEYWVHIDAEVFRFSVGSPDADLFEVTAGSMSTGLLSGGELSVNAGNPAALDISAFTGYVVDEITDPDSPAVTRVRSNGFVGVPLAGASLTRVITWWLADSTGALIQQAARPTNTQRRTHLVLGVTAYDPGSGSIFADQSLPVITAQAGNQLADLMDAMRPFVVDGNVITANGANLSLAKSSGTVFARAFNHFAGAAPTRDPHVSDSAAQALVTFRRLTRVAQFPPPATTTLVDPAQYDNAGVLTPVVGNDATIQRVWLFPANTVADQIAVQYGQQLFPDFQTALDALGSGSYVPNPTTVQNAALVAWIIVRGNATMLNDLSQCIIRRAQPLNFP